MKIIQSNQMLDFPFQITFSDFFLENAQYLKCLPLFNPHYLKCQSKKMV